MAKIKNGDYVLASKYRDGDPKDQWAIGFYDRLESGRHYITDANGAQLRRNGFRRVMRITQQQADFMLANSGRIDESGRSVWHWAQRRIETNG